MIEQAANKNLQEKSKAYYGPCQTSLRKKWSFPSKIFSVNMTKSSVENAIPHAVHLRWRPLKKFYPRCLTGTQIYLALPAPPPPLPTPKQPPYVLCKARFTKFTKKQLCWSFFFNKVVGLNLPETCNFILEKDSNTAVFLWIFVKVWRTLFLQNTFRRLLPHLCEIHFQINNHQEQLTRGFL